MRLTIRQLNDRYIDLDIDVANRICTCLSPIPDISKTELQQIADDYSYYFKLPITNETIIPANKIPQYKLDFQENISTFELICLIIVIANYIISEEN